ncbi:hypothetical protein COV18_03005 [Candidatus Woesearchaeota archaeon CG10_big_fil_rev_8_21_14_0_10_37_12]|nr:MAG: hypothetical protein COV18_03005 [Candidatus Woesearchaeota archaeon CG10_big_fil_rev_8_21_14_0_10_37_12]
MKLSKAYKESPLAEVTLRKYEKPFRLSGRDLVKKLCLSLGILQPGDRRDVIIDVFMVLLHANKPLTSQHIEEEVKKLRKQHKLPVKGVAPSNVRRQVKRLRDLFFVERVGNLYRITENEQLHTIFSERIEKFYLPVIVSRVKEYCEAVEKQRGSNGSDMQKM